MILLLVFSAIAILILLGEIQRWRISRKLRHIPGPPQVPIIGTTYLFKNHEDIFVAMNDLYDGPVTKFFIGPMLVLNVASPEIVQKILNSQACLDRPYTLHFLRSPYGVLAARYPIWKNIRKPLNPSFNSVMVQSYVPVFDAYAKKFVEELEEYEGKGDFNIWELLKDTFLKVIFESSTDTSYEQSGLKEEYLGDFVENFVHRVSKVWLHPEFIYRCTKHYIREEKLLLKFFISFEKAIETRWKIVEKSIQDPNNNSEDNNNKDMIFLDKLFTMCDVKGQRLTIEQVASNLVTVISAGYDTLAQTVSYVILMLAMHPDVQERVAKEVGENYVEDGEVDMDKLKHFPYLDRVISETMRLFPPVPVIARASHEEADLGICKIPRDTMIALNLFRLHRQKDIWGSDADNFNPDNFLPEVSAKRPLYSYVPYSSGMRNCIGYRYANAAMRVFLLRIINRYEFTTPLKMEELKFKLSMTLTLENGHMVSLKKRE